MSGIEISDLPNEMIMKILRCLEPADLNKAMLTCKLWNNLIESSCPRSFKVFGSNSGVNYDEQRIDFLLTTNRKFEKIEWKGDLSIGRTKTIEIFRRHGFDVVSLSLVDVFLDSLTTFTEILKCMPNLKELHTLNVRTLSYVTDVPTESLPELSKLKTLQMAGSQYRIVKCLKKTKLTTIKVLNSTYSYSLDCEDLEVFLKSQDALTTLAIRAIYHNKSMLFRTQNLNASVPFQLTRLSLLYIQLELDPETLPNNKYNNLLKFLEQQATSLKELELGHRFPRSVYQFVFANMANLKTLNVMMGQIPQEKELFERLQVNHSINNLIFKESPRYNNESAQFYRSFLERLPNVTSLTIMNECCKEIILVIAQTLKKLEMLRVGFFIDCHDVQFANLKTLHIDFEQKDNFDWNEFTKINPRITELTIESADYLNLNDIETITTNNNLQTLRLGGDGFTADKRFFEIIRKNCPDLKRLALQESCVLHEGTDHTDPMDRMAHVLRVCERDDLNVCPTYSRFWNELLYADVEVWDEMAATVDPFDYLMMDQTMDVDTEDEDEDYDDNWDEGGFVGNNYDFGDDFV